MVGIGYDIHALKKGRKLWLGGIQIPHSKGLLGHSDGDVLLHSITDALLGAAGLGDIGDYFPNSDKTLKNASSDIFVKRAIDLLKRNKLKIVNIDSTLITEEPKIAPYKDEIRKKIASICGLGIFQVGLKAKTNEGFGQIGKGQAMACISVASLEEN